MSTIEKPLKIRSLINRFGFGKKLENDDFYTAFELATLANSKDKTLARSAKICSAAMTELGKLSGPKTIDGNDVISILTKVIPNIDTVCKSNKTPTPIKTCLGEFKECAEKSIKVIEETMAATLEAPEQTSEASNQLELA